MFDGFWSGFFGGWLAPHIAPWLHRFKYPVLFMLGFSGTYVFLFLSGAASVGYIKAAQIMVAKALTLVGILVPVSGGSFLMFIAWIYALNKPAKNRCDGTHDKNDQ